MSVFLTRLGSVVSDLIANRGLLASWDDSTSVVLMHHSTASKVEGTALTLIDSLGMLTDSVEKLDRWVAVAKFSFGAHVCCTAVALADSACALQQHSKQANTFRWHHVVYIF